MSFRVFSLVALLCICVSQPARSADQDFSYAAIAERNASTRLDPKSVRAAKMHGECMVGLKQLIFVKRSDFDPIAEWVNYRTYTLLEQFPPCDVLIMMEVAHAELMKQDAES